MLSVLVILNFLVTLCGGQLSLPISIETDTKDDTRHYLTVDIVVGSGPQTITCELDTAYWTTTVTRDYICNSPVGNTIINDPTFYAALCPSSQSTSVCTGTTSCAGSIPCLATVIGSGSCCYVH